MPDKNQIPARWTVKIKAIIDDDIRNQLEMIKAEHAGLNAKNAWITALTDQQPDVMETTLCKEDVFALSGFIDLEDKVDALPNETVQIWMPSTPGQVMTVKEAFISRADTRLGHRIDAYLNMSLLYDAYSCIISGPVGSRKITGIIGFDRELYIDENAAFLHYDIPVFHSEGTAVERAALLAALYLQMRLDFETAFISLAAAGVDKPITMVIEDDDDLISMISTFNELSDEALGEAFERHADELPDWVDLDQYSLNIKGRVHGDQISRVTSSKM